MACSVCGAGLVATISQTELQVHKHNMNVNLYRSTYQDKSKCKTINASDVADPRDNFPSIHKREQNPMTNIMVEERGKERCCRQPTAIQNPHLSHDQTSQAFSSTASPLCVHPSLVRLKTGNTKCAKSLTRNPTITARGTTTNTLIQTPKPRLIATLKPATATKVTMCA
jgi:hypothetical protein